MEQTQKYKLNKPGGSDYADVDALNENAEKLDAALDGLEQGKAPKSHTHTAAQVGADPAGSAAAALTAAKQDATTKANKAEQNAKDASEKAGAVAEHDAGPTTHMDLRNALAATNTLAAEAKAIAEGRSRAVAYATNATMVAAVNIMTRTAMRVGDNLLIEAVGVPDLWVCKVESAAVIYAYTTDEALEAALENGPVQMGYYKLSMLETPKVDLSGYVTKATTINGKALTGNITLTAADVGARPAAWVPGWDDVHDKPTEFVPKAHGHPVSEISGALKQFGPMDITIPVSGWSGAGPWIQSVAVAGVLASFGDWRLELHGARIADNDARKANEKALGCVTECDTCDGGITLTCREKKPEGNIAAVLSGEV